MSERRDDWGTPAWLFEALDAELRFTVDACAHALNHKLPRYWDRLDDGLAQDWASERVWCNPPYGAGIGRWIRKAHESGGLAAVLVPVRSESTWWHRHVLEASELRFIEGRVHFDMPGRTRSESRPVFASAVAIFGTGDGLVVSSMATPRVTALRSQPELFA